MSTSHVSGVSPNDVRLIVGHVPRGLAQEAMCVLAALPGIQNAVHRVAEFPTIAFDHQIDQD